MKPRSDNEPNNLVILLPAKWNNSFRDVWLEDQNGIRHNDTGRRNINLGDNNNGYRRHIWFKKPGDVIGRGTLVVVLSSETKRLEYNFAKRTEKVP